MYALDSTRQLNLSNFSRIMRQGKSNVRQPIQTSNFCHGRNTTYEPDLIKLTISSRGMANSHYDTPVGNHGSSQQNKYPVEDDEYNKNDSLQAHLIEEICHCFGVINFCVLNVGQETAFGLDNKYKPTFGERLLTISKSLFFMNTIFIFYYTEL